LHQENTPRERLVCSCWLPAKETDLHLNGLRFKAFNPCDGEINVISKKGGDKVYVEHF